MSQATPDSSLSYVCTYGAWTAPDTTPTGKVPDDFTLNSPVGVHADAPKTAPQKKIGKLVKKDKKRQPRKDKKLAKKLEAAKKA